MQRFSPRTSHPIYDDHDVFSVLIEKVCVDKVEPLTEIGSDLSFSFEKQTTPCDALDDDDEMEPIPLADDNGILMFDRRSYPATEQAVQHNPFAHQATSKSIASSANWARSDRADGMFRLGQPWNPNHQIIHDSILSSPEVVSSLSSPAPDYQVCDLMLISHHVTPALSSFAPGRDSLGDGALQAKPAISTSINRGSWHSKEQILPLQYKLFGH